MISGSAGVAVATAAVSAGAATSSTFGMMTWTSMRSRSLTGFHFALVAMSRTRMPWCSISSLTSTSMCSGMSAGSTSISTSRRMNSRMPPCCFTPFGSPWTTIGMVTCSSLSIAMRKKSTCRTSCVTGSSWKSFTRTRLSPAPASFSEISVFWPASECRILSSAFGWTAIGVAPLPPPPYSTPGTWPPRRVRRASFFPNVSRACASSIASISFLALCPLPYTNNEETEVSS